MSDFEAEIHELVYRLNQLIRYPDNVFLLRDVSKAVQLYRGCLIDQVLPHPKDVAFLCRAGCPMVVETNGKDKCPWNGDWADPPIPPQDVIQCCVVTLAALKAELEARHG